MLTITLLTQNTRAQDYDLFETELVKYNLSIKVTADECNSELITLRVNTRTEEESKLVRDLAALCFGSLHSA